VSRAFPPQTKPSNPLLSPDRGLKSEKFKSKICFDIPSSALAKWTNDKGSPILKRNILAMKMLTQSLDIFKSAF
jgi:hypothetical protein